MEKRSRSLWLCILHPCQWFYIWLHCCTECTVFLCGWWQWWGSRVEMGFSCSCFSLTLAQQWVKTLLGHKRSVCLPATLQDFHHPTQLSHISPDMWWNDDSSVRRCSTVSICLHSGELWMFLPCWRCFGRFTTLVEAEISEQLCDGLPWNFAQTFMIPRWWILMTLHDYVVDVCGSEWNVSTDYHKIWCRISAHVALWMNYNNFGDPWLFIPCQHHWICNLSSTLVHD